jgi:hypothetical protein
MSSSSRLNSRCWKEMNELTAHEEAIMQYYFLHEAEKSFC